MPLNSEESTSVHHYPPRKKMIELKLLRLYYLIILQFLLIIEKKKFYGLIFYFFLCDCFSKWTGAFAIPDQEPSTIAKLIVNESICRFVTPLQLHFDQGRSIEFNLYKDML